MCGWNGSCSPGRFVALGILMANVRDVAKHPNILMLRRHTSLHRTVRLAIEISMRAAKFPKSTKRPGLHDQPQRLPITSHPEINSFQIRCRLAVPCPRQFRFPMMAATPVPRCPLQQPRSGASRMRRAWKDRIQDTGCTRASRASNFPARRANFSKGPANKRAAD
jgi:hypothetical protein